MLLNLSLSIIGFLVPPGFVMKSLQRSDDDPFVSFQGNDSETIGLD